MPEPLNTNISSFPNYTPPQQQPSPATPIVPKKHHFVLWLLFVLIIIAGAAAFAYTQKIWPFALNSYSESNLLSGLLNKYSTINSGSYTISGSLNVGDRDPGAMPFELKVSNEGDMKKKYFYDAQRGQDASSIIRELLEEMRISKKFPVNLSALLNKKTHPYANISLKDPETDADYAYKLTNNGSDFALTVNFTVADNIQNIKKYEHSATSTIISGNSVTFTKNSNPYIYLSEQPPRPFFATLSESLAMLPNDVKVSLSASASTEFKQDASDVKANLDAEGYFGDLTYKINFDALKKDKDFYFKINNIPSLFLFGGLGNAKGKWIKVAENASSSEYSFFNSFAKDLPEEQEKYKERREKAAKLIKKMTALADDQKLITFKNDPKTEKVGERSLVRYDLKVEKDKLLGFYESLKAEIESDPDFSDFKEVVDQGLVDYLKSDEFNQVFDYFDKNNQFVLWTDADGNPAMFKNIMRIVPPDEATQLKDKQINIVFTLTLDDINKPINVEVPKDAVPIEELTKASDDYSGLSEARGKAKTASISAALSSLRSEAELVYSSDNNSYGQKPFALGPCKATANTLFATANFQKNLSLATDNKIDSATCVSSGTTGNVDSWAASAPLPNDEGFSFCVDSTGVASRIVDKLKGKSCK